MRRVARREKGVHIDAAAKPRRKMPSNPKPVRNANDDDNPAAEVIHPIKLRSCLCPDCRATLEIPRRMYMYRCPVCRTRFRPCSLCTLEDCTSCPVTGSREAEAIHVVKGAKTA